MSRADTLQSFFSEFLNCRVRVPDLKKEDPFALWLAALEEGKKKAYCPLLIAADDILAESCLFNSDPLSAERDEAFIDLKSISAFRKNILSEEREKLPDALFKNYALVYDTPLPDVNVIKSKAFECVSVRESAVIDPENLEGRILLLAEIPVQEPWQIMAYMPFGSFNDCPDCSLMLAAAERWYKEYGLIPCSVSSDELEFYCASGSIDKEKAAAAALEMFAFCPEGVEENYDGVCGLAGSLPVSDLIYFYWS